MAAQAMIVLRIGHAPAPIVATVARFVKTVALMAAQAMVVLRIGHAAAPIVAAVARFCKDGRSHVRAVDDRTRDRSRARARRRPMARFVEALGLLAAQSMILLRVRYAAAWPAMDSLRPRRDIVATTMPELLARCELSTCVTPRDDRLVHFLLLLILL